MTTVLSLIIAGGLLTAAAVLLALLVAWNHSRRLDALETKFRRRSEALGAAYAARAHVRALQEREPRR